MPNLGPMEIVLILLVFILLFGAKKLPDLGSSVGKSIKNFKKGLSESEAQDAAAKDAEAKDAEGSGEHASKPLSRDRQ